GCRADARARRPYFSGRRSLHASGGPRREAGGTVRSRRYRPNHPRSVMKTRITWLEDMSYVAQSASGHALVLDGPPELGGRNLGPRPMELLLMGMGGCTAVDVVNILRKARQDLRGCELQLDAERADSDPKVFTTIRVHFILTGRNLNGKQVERAITLSAEKYCSASIMLGKTAQISHTFEIRDA
ncbi:MAG TPA: OsmC family protein, partial [Candidatus Competibacteraceae bacterium]|nr:OsmC family protein [Candidatus Competibacteraceae bacterium]